MKYLIKNKNVALWNRIQVGEEDKSSSSRFTSLCSARVGNVYILFALFFEKFERAMKAAL